MGRLSKDERKKRSRAFKAEELTALRNSMPLTVEQLDQLLNYLDNKLPPCDHTTQHSRVFLEKSSLDPEVVFPWLGKQGGYCDCEVLFNLEDLVGLLAPSVPSPRKPKPKRQPRSLANAIGWDLGKLPKPWKVANLYSNDEPIQLQLGRSGGCTLKIREESEFSIDEPDDHWSRRWYEKTGLPPKGEILIERELAALPSPVRSVLTKTAAWIPVFVWIDTGGCNCHLEMRSEWNRVAGDLNEVAKLIKHYSTD